MKSTSAKPAGFSIRLLSLLVLALTILIVGILLTVSGARFNSQLPTNGDFVALFAGGGLLVLGLLLLVWVLQARTQTRLKPIYSLLLIPVGILVAIWSLGLINGARFQQSRVAANAHAARVLQELQFDLGSYTFAGSHRATRWQKLIDSNVAELSELKNSLNPGQEEVAECVDKVESLLIQYDQLLQEDVFPNPGMAPEVERRVRARRTDLLTKVNTSITNLRTELSEFSIDLSRKWQHLSFLALFSGVLVLGLAAMGYYQLRETERRRKAEQELHQQERRLRMMLEQLPAMVWTTDNELMITSSDGAGLTSIALEPGQLVGLSLYDYLQTTDPSFQPLAAHLDALKGHNTNYQLEWNDRRLMAFVRPLLDGNGDISGTIGAAWDITALWQAEVALRQKERLAALGTMAAGIAHEINNPLWMISLQAEAATVANNSNSNNRPSQNGDTARSSDSVHGGGGDTVPSIQIDEALQNIQELVARGGKIVSNILRFAGKTSGEQSKGQIMDPIVCSVELSQKRAQQNGVTIELVSAADLPAAEFNATEIEQVFVNLLNNAIDASNDGGKIIVRCEHQDHEIRVTVEDSGAGIPEEDLVQIFNPFYTTRRNDGGTGLGLAICDRIIKDHSGQIRADSEVGSGTRIV